jgi:hypothetical protein
MGADRGISRRAKNESGNGARRQGRSRCRRPDIRAKRCARKARHHLLTEISQNFFLQRDFLDPLKILMRKIIRLSPAKTRNR